MIKLENYISRVLIAGSLYLRKITFSSVKRDFMYLLVASFIGGLVSFLSQIIIAKFIDPVAVGQIRVIYSYANTAVIIAGFGFSTAVLKMCSEKIEDGKKRLILVSNLKYVLFPISLVLISMWFLLMFGLLSPDDGINKWMKVYLFSIPILVYTEIITSYLVAQKRIVLVSKIRLWYYLIHFGLITSAAYFWGLAGVIFFTLLSIGLYLFFLIKALHGFTAPPLVSHLSGYFQRSFNIAKWSFGANLIHSTAIGIDIFLLNFLIKNRTEFGYYTIALLFVTGLSYFTFTIRTIAIPRLSENYNNKDKFMLLTRKYFWITILMSMIILLISVVVIPEIVRLFYGPDYFMVSVFFRILILKYFFLSSYAILGAAILALGRVKYNFFAAVLFFIVALTLNYTFILKMGIIGAAWAQVLSYLLMSIITFYTFKLAIQKHFSER